MPFSIFFKVQSHGKRAERPGDKALAVLWAENSQARLMTASYSYSELLASHPSTPQAHTMLATAWASNSFRRLVPATKKGFAMAISL